MLDSIPHEILITIFEIVIYTWGIHFLPRFRLVCRTWNIIVVTTPRLWGIVVVDKRSDPTQLARQVSMAKQSPLSITIRHTQPAHEKGLRMLLDLASNWVDADISTSMLRPRRCIDLYMLETLRLKFNGKMGDFDAWEFFNTQGVTPLTFPRLRYFAAYGLPESWLLPFLSPSITSFEFHPRAALKLLQILRYLSQIPQIASLLLHGVEPSDFYLPQNFKLPLPLPHLTSLEINRVTYPVTILSELVAPSLRTLVIKDSQIPTEQPPWIPPFLHRPCRPELIPLSPFFIAWSQPKSLPVHLRSLTLSQCLGVSDVAFLIRWLARLPHLTCLGLHDDAIARAAELPPSREETNLFAALASPDGAGAVGGWLCPSLTRLQFSTADLQMKDILPLARARGRWSKHLNSNVPRSFLHFLDAPLCPSGSAQEIDELRELVDEVVCTCLGCQFKLFV
ncbi:hypothetical protein H2248_002841 [Termitomyces sp. 'cryptogamus']|nr:hypothetical protein H2248_002841 [Termitomyces sp. 'cryptogamus']